MKKALYFLKGNIKELILLLFLTCVIYAIEAVTHPLLLKFIFDEAIMLKKFRLFLFLITIYLFLGIFINLTSLGLNLWSKRFENKMISKITNRMLRSYYQKDYNSIIQKGQGYYIGRIYKDVVEGVAPFLNSIKSLAANLTRVISFLGILFYLSWQGTLILLLFTPLIIYFSNFLNKKIKSVTQLEREEESNFLNVLEKSISSYKFVNIFGYLGHILKKNIQSISEYLKALYKNFKLILTYQHGVYVIMNISDFLSILVGAFLVLKGKLGFGGYLAFVTAFWRAMTGISDFFKPLGELNRSLSIINRLYKFEKAEKTNYYVIGENVILENIHFSYNNVYVFRGFSMKIEKGEKILIEGANGSGKTTLANILSGFLKPSEGRVTLPSSISSYTLPWYFPLMKIKELHIKEDILNKLGLAQYKEKYPDELSAGLKQRLAIGLVLSLDAQLYIFDEPLANLDKNSSPLVMDMIFEKTKGKTLIVIMHKGEEWSSFFDKIVNLDKLKERRCHNE